MRRSEYPHHTPEQIRGYLDEAMRLVDVAAIADDLRGIAFSKAVDLLAAKNIVMEQAAMGVDLSKLGIRQ